jgi:hypothetical protein
MSESASSSQTFSVLVIDMAHYREEGSDMLIGGFLTRVEAIEYARCRVRSSVEELRKANQTAEELRKLWTLYGEDAMVIGADYSGSSELGHFIAQQTPAEACDWSAIEKRLGTRLYKRIAD